MCVTGKKATLRSQFCPSDVGSGDGLRCQLRQYALSPAELACQCCLGLHSLALDFLSRHESFSSSVSLRILPPCFSSSFHSMWPPVCDLHSVWPPQCVTSTVCNFQERIQYYWLWITETQQHDGNPVADSTKTAGHWWQRSWDPWLLGHLCEDLWCGFCSPSLSQENSSSW